MVVVKKSKYAEALQAFLSRVMYLVIVLSGETTVTTRARGRLVTWLGTPGDELPYPARVQLSAGRTNDGLAVYLAVRSCIYMSRASLFLVLLLFPFFSSFCTFQLVLRHSRTVDPACRPPVRDVACLLRVRLRTDTSVRLPPTSPYPPPRTSPGPSPIRSIFSSLHRLVCVVY